MLSGNLYADETWTSRSEGTVYTELTELTELEESLKLYLEEHGYGIEKEYPGTPTFVLRYLAQTLGPTPSAYNVFCYNKLTATYLVKGDHWTFIWRYTDGSAIRTDQGFMWPSPPNRSGYVRHQLTFDMYDPNSFPSFLAALEDSKGCLERSYGFILTWGKTIEGMKERFVNLLRSWVLWVVVISVATLLLKYAL